MVVMNCGQPTVSPRSGFRPMLALPGSDRSGRTGSATTALTPPRGRRQRQRDQPPPSPGPACQPGGGGDRADGDHGRVEAGQVVGLAVPTRYAAASSPNSTGTKRSARIAGLRQAVTRPATQTGTSSGETMTSWNGMKPARPPSAWPAMLWATVELRPAVPLLPDQVRRTEHHGDGGTDPQLTRPEDPARTDAGERDKGDHRDEGDLRFGLEPDADDDPGPEQRPGIGRGSRRGRAASPAARWRARRRSLS